MSLGGGEGSELRFHERSPKPHTITRHHSLTTTSFREDRSSAAVRSNPIDPSTYSFTSALKALQVTSGYNRCCDANAFALNPKWTDAEKYICNPLSGQVPLQCLSAKTLSGRSFRRHSDTITFPPYRPNPVSATPSPSNSTLTQDTDPDTPTFLVSEQEKKIEWTRTRDVGIQSTMLEPSWSGPSHQFVLRSLKPCEPKDAPVLSLTSKQHTMEKEEDQLRATKREEERKRSSRQGGCLPWSWMMRKRMREKHKSRKNYMPTA